MKSLLAGFVLLSPLASAQNVVFQENFEGGVAQWTATGLWQAQSQAGVCASPAVPFPNGDGAAWYGNPATCSIDDGTGNHGTLKMNDWITLPTGVASVTLYFKSYVHSEYCWGGWDRHQVVVTTNGGPAGFTRDICTDVVASTHTLQTWHERRVDLTAYRGAQIKIAFGFISGDNGEQTGLGWLVDDVRVLAEPGQTICPSPNPSTWCSCPIWSAVGGGCFNALGKSATLISSGSASVSNDTLAFAAAEMIPGTAGTLFQGTSAAGSPPKFGDGILCLTGTLMRLGTQFAPTGSCTWPIAALGSLSSAGFVPPGGGVFYYQVIYRDATPTYCTNETFNLTSAQQVNWIP